MFPYYLRRLKALQLHPGIAMEALQRIKESAFWASSPSFGTISGHTIPDSGDLWQMVCLRHVLIVAAWSTIGGWVLATALAVPVLCLGAPFVFLDDRFPVCLSVLGTWGIVGAGCGFAVGVSMALVVSWLMPRDVQSATYPAVATSRRSVRFHRAWRTFWIVLPIVAYSTSLGTFALSLGTYSMDGFECIGWPIAFHGFGGFAARQFYDLTGLAIDISVWVGIAALVGLTLRYGPFRLSIKSLRLLGARPWRTGS